MASSPKGAVGFEPTSPLARVSLSYLDDTRPCFCLRLHRPILLGCALTIPQRGELK